MAHVRIAENETRLSGSAMRMSHERTSIAPPSLSVADVALMMGVGILLTWVWWEPLWSGGSLIGGDIYPYFMPQKAYLKQALAQGEFPLWNDLTGHGYPLLAESQTGALYPPTLLLTWACTVTDAYNYNQLLHYIAAFAAAGAYLRWMGQSRCAAMFAALVYVYGWFPSRICLEWAIIGGAYLPLVLLTVELWLATRTRTAGVVLSLLLGVQLLAGHFNLAFLLFLTLLVYVPFRAGQRADSVLNREVLLGTCAPLFTYVLAGYVLAAVQLWPTFELKQYSQRAEADKLFKLGYGHIPPGGWLQLVTPWLFYQPDVDLDLMLNRMPSMVVAGTNRVEAQLYAGLAPLALLLLAAARWWRSSRSAMPLVLLWFAIALLALAYTPGWLLPITRYLPGFNFFSGPGRYGMLVLWSLACLTGMAFDALLQCRPWWQRRTAWLCLVLVTSIDQMAIFPYVSNSTAIEYQALTFVAQSSLLKRLPQPLHNVRLFAPGPNVLNLLHVSSTPQYLGIGPREYFDPALTYPQFPNDPPWTYRPEQLAWMRHAGVTHVVTLEPAKAPATELRPISRGPDLLLNAVWGRVKDGKMEDVFLYELTNAPGRLQWEGPADGDRTAKVVSRTVNEVVISATTSAPAQLVLTELAFPGWSVTLDGQAATASVARGMYRSVNVPAGEHILRWRYQPASVWGGAAVSLATLVGLIVWVAQPQRRPTSE